MTHGKPKARSKPPAWVPPLVVSVAGAMRGCFDPEVVDRLLTDSRMEAVWTVLRQHPVKELPADLDGNLRADHWIGPVETLSPKDEAAVVFFAAVVIQVWIRNEPQARSDISAFCARFANAAQTARNARLNPFLCPPDADDIAALARAETILAQIAANIERRAQGHPLVLGRRRTDKEGDATRALVRSIAKRTKTIFGEVLYGTVATVANIALKLEVDLDTAKVRDWSEGLDPCQ
jgi:hypothetical protein